MSIKEQQVLAQELLEKLEIIDPTCILAGGAPRDWYLGKECNDLDFYLHIKHEALHSILHRFKRLKLEVKCINWNGTGCHYEVMEHLRHVFEGEYKGQKFNIMIMNTPTFDSVVNHFGTSVCKAWWKGIDHNIQVTLDFLISHYSKVIFKKDDYTAKVLHVDKMTRYPDYKVIDYSEFDKYEDLVARKLNVYPSSYNLTRELTKRIKGED